MANNSRVTNVYVGFELSGLLVHFGDFTAVSSLVDVRFCP